MIDRHGPHTACSVEHSEKLVLEYLQTEEWSQHRRDIERQYGRATILKLVKNYQEEIVNQQYMKASTTGCPKCDVRVEKSHGCNHVGNAYVDVIRRSSTTDDVSEMRYAFLLPMRKQVERTGPLLALFCGGVIVLLQII
jgi:hypothetical protein